MARDLGIVCVGVDSLDDADKNYQQHTQTRHNSQR